MTVEQRANIIIARLRNMEYDVSDESTHAYAVRLVQDEWTDDEIVKFLKCTEECNPALEEDIALSRMRDIIRGVEQRLGRKTRRTP